MGSGDGDFLAALEAGTLPPERVDHRGLLRAGFLYLTRHDFPGACVAMKQTIRRFAAALGKADLYHETVTIAYLALIAERLIEEPPSLSFTDILARYPELVSREYFERYYAKGALDSPEAKATFVLPRPRE